jgi:choice-of-anchor B domain-containing protein
MRLLSPILGIAFLLNATPASAQFVPCIDGMAGEFECQNVDLLAHLDLEVFGSESGNDSWGWTDPMTGREIAIMCLDDGTAFVDITDPARSIYLGKLPTHTAPSVWRDAKVYGDFVFVVSEAEGHGMQVFDMSRLREVARGQAPVTFTADAHYDAVGHSHNVVINEETGLAVIVGNREARGCAGGLHMVDIRNPLNPTFAGCFAEDGYTHDAQCVIYRGPDTRYAGREICFASNEDTVTLVDVTDRANPTMLSQAIYPNVGYTHQGWLTEGQAYFLANDELDEQRYGFDTRTLIFDVSDLENPFFVGPHSHGVPSIDHNLYVRGEAVYFANYMSGLRVAIIEDLSVPDLTNVGFFDTHPEGIATEFEGAWSNYPFFGSGSVVISDINRGLFVVRPYREEALVLTHFHAFPTASGALVQWVLDPADIERVVVEDLSAEHPTELGMVRVGEHRNVYRLLVDLPAGERTVRLRAVDSSGLSIFSDSFVVTGGERAAQAGR